MNRIKYILLSVLIIGGLFSVNRMNRHLVDYRKTSGITQADPVINAPPMVVFTTVALGGFRGIIADILWVRSAKLQYEGKFFELVQLADWITKLEPRFSEVWAYHAWNLSYNISVLFPDYNDRWRWVRHGISLLRDEGLLYNPGDPGLLIELGWLYQHKLGGASDDANMVYKQAWAEEMETLLGSGRPDYASLSHNTILKMREEYKLDPGRMQEIETAYGPLDWRMPQTHAIYWATLGREQSNADKLLFAERMIYQSMADAFRQGKAGTGDGGQFIPVPDFELFPYVVQSYIHAIDVFAKTPGPHESYLSFLTEAVLLFYLYGHDGDAYNVLEMLKTLQPELPSSISVEDFIVVTYSRQQPGADQNSPQKAAERARNDSRHYREIGDSDRAKGYDRLADAIGERTVDQNR